MPKSTVTALTLARQLSDRHQQARALSALGSASRVRGDPAEARRRWQRAVTIYIRLGAPEATAVQAALDGVGAAT